MTELSFRARSHSGGLWEIELLGTPYRGAGATIREAFESLLEQIFDISLKMALKAMAPIDPHPKG